MSPQGIAPPRPMRQMVAFAPGVWGWPEFAGSPRYHLWSLAARGWRILFVEPPRRFQFSTRTWKAPDRDFWVLTPGLTPPFGMRAVRNEAIGSRWRERTSKRLWKLAERAVASIGMKPTAYWFGAPWHGSIAQLAPRDPHILRISHTYDELSASPALSADQRRILWDWERELIRDMDLALCSSDPQRYRRKSLPSRAILIENAVCDDHLPEALGPVPARHEALVARIEALPKPVIMYGGVLDLRLSPDILEAVADAVPDGSVVFAGKVDDSYDRESLKRLRRMRNVHFLGELPYSAYPHLYGRASVLIIAHKRNEFTTAMYPEKLNEYLCSGQPIVSVSLPEVARASREIARTDAIRMADSPAEFVEECRRAAAEAPDSPLKVVRLDYARSKTWSVIADKLDREIEYRFREKAGNGNGNGGSGTAVAGLAAPGGAVRPPGVTQLRK